MYDVVVVGTRIAGAATARLLAQRGLRVLAVDRATFPSDTLSTHQLQVAGGARLHRWGLLDRIVAAGTPPTRRVRFATAGITLDGTMPSHEGVDALYSPRRTLLDATLVAAAREAGAEVRENVVVEELVTDGGAVAGVRLREKGAASSSVERARLVVGADGKHSMVAKAVGATVKRRVAPRTVASYAYWEGVPLDRGLMLGAPRRAVGVWATNDGLTLTYVARPIEEFDALRRDPEAGLLRTLDDVGLGAAVRAGRRVERLRSSPDLPNELRASAGPGWALVGDAGCVIDPITGQGMSHALEGAELLADAVAAGLGDSGGDLARALRGYERARDRAVLPMFRFTTQLAALKPPGRMEELLFGGLARTPENVARFFGVLAGVRPVSDLTSPAAVLRTIGLRPLLTRPHATEAPAS